MEDMAQDLSIILEKLESPEVNMVGSSFGGMLALKFFSLFPGKVKRLVFVGSLPRFSKSEDYQLGIEIQRIRKLKSQLETSYPTIIDIFFRSLFTRHERESRRFKWLQKFRKTDIIPQKEALSELLDILEKEDLRGVLQEARVPIQFINGTDDYLCSKESIQFWQETFPHLRFDFFEGCGHFPFLSKPHEFNQVLQEFLQPNGTFEYRQT
jgi:pimeloyl-[acyl-carrier protein] methyl ester esterase